MGQGSTDKARVKNMEDVMMLWVTVLDCHLRITLAMSGNNKKWWCVQTNPNPMLFLY